MAHNLARKADGSAAMFSLKEKPWHGLGTILDKAIDDSEVLEMAGLNWSVDLEPVYQGISRPVMDSLDEYVTSFEEVDQFRFVKRSDTQQILGMVNRSFKVVQNQSMVDLFRGLAGVDHELIWETAGCLGNGEIIFGLVKIPDLMIRIGKDETIPYLLFSNGHIGNMMTNVCPTLIRVVCNNTLSAAEEDACRRRRRGGRNATNGYRLRHTQNIDQRLKEIQAVYGNSLKAIEHTKSALEIMASKTLTDELFRQIVAKSWTATDDAAEESTDEPIAITKDESERSRAMKVARETKRLEDLGKILASETCQVEGTKGTVFSALQSITQFIDHERPTQQRRAISDQAARFESAQFGNGAQIKNRAFKAALEAAGVL